MDFLSVLVGGAPNQEGLTSDMRVTFRSVNFFIYVAGIILLILTINSVLMDWYMLSHNLSREGTVPNMDDASDSAKVVYAAPQSTSFQIAHAGTSFSSQIVKSILASVIGLIVTRFLQLNVAIDDILYLGRHGDSAGTVLKRNWGRLQENIKSIPRYAMEHKAQTFLITGSILAVPITLYLWSSDYGPIPFVLLLLAVVVFMVYGRAYRMKEEARAAIELSMQARGNKDIVEAVRDLQSVEDSKKDEDVSVIVAGMVGAGKTSLVKALLGSQKGDDIDKALYVGMMDDDDTDDEDVDRQAPPRKKEPTRFQRGRLIFYDLPGQMRVDGPSREKIPRADVGIMVVAGSADANQREAFRALRAAVGKAYVVRSKCDRDLFRMKPDAQEKYLEQWQTTLDVSKVHMVCANGYDVDTRDDVVLDIRGVDQLRSEIEAHLKKNHKSIVMARKAYDKDRQAHDVIVKACSTAFSLAIVDGHPAHLEKVLADNASKLMEIYTGQRDTKGLEHRLEVGPIPFASYIPGGTAIMQTLICAVRLLAMQKALSAQARTGLDRNALESNAQKYTEEMSASDILNWEFISTLAETATYQSGNVMGGISAAVDRVIEANLGRQMSKMGVANSMNVGASTSSGRITELN
eukprot:Clim_evm97s147 gene=Clim_evmTU97s147